MPSGALGSVKHICFRSFLNGLGILSVGLKILSRKIGVRRGTSNRLQFEAGERKLLGKTDVLRAGRKRKVEKTRPGRTGRKKTGKGIREADNNQKGR